jgi:biofilm PGA synthesis protein PgaA
LPGVFAIPKFLSLLRASVGVVGLLSAISSHAHAADTLNSKRAAAVRQARDGDTKTSLAALHQLLQQYPDDSGLLADTTIVSNWAGNDALALETYSRRQTPKDDADVVEAAARSARNLHDYNLATELFRRAHTLDPRRWQAYLGEAMVLTDRGECSSAATVMQPLLREHGKEKDVILGEAYLCSRQADFTCSIAMYQRYLEQFPNDVQVRGNLNQMLSRAGAESYASQLYADNVTPGSFDTELSLSAAVGGEEVRWGEAYAPSRAEQRAESEAALARLDRVITSSKINDASWRSAQYDRIMVLYDLYRMHDATHSYEQLRRQGIDIPTYALNSVAGSYLALRQPERAETLYRKVVAETPLDGRAWSGLAYAQMEREHYREALATIDHAYQTAAPWLQSPGLNAPRANLMRMNLESQAAEMRGNIDLLAREQTWLGDLVALAPANENLRWQLASSYLARGWPHLALAESRIADGLASPDELPTLASAQIYEAAGLRDDVDSILPILRERQFDSPAFRRFQRDQAIGRGWQFDTETAFGSGSGVQVGSSDQHVEAHLFTPLLHNRWRAYGHELSDRGVFVNGSAERTRESIGVHYDYSRQTAWAEFGHDTGTDRNAGNIGAKVSLGDYWTLRAEADSDSFDVPVRAVARGVHGRSVDLTLGWRGSELHSADIGLQRVLFNDGNQRAAIPASWNERVWTTPRWQLSLGAQEWASSNSLDENRLYFNPKHDFSLGPRGVLDWLTWHRYDHSFRQEIGAYAAPYWQENYGTGGAVALHYGQRWKLRAGMELQGGVTWNSQPYDGRNEYRTALDAGITWGTP